MQNKRFGFFIGWNVWNSRTWPLNFLFGRELSLIPTKCSNMYEQQLLIFQDKCSVVCRAVSSNGGRLGQNLEKRHFEIFQWIRWTAEGADFACEYAPTTDSDLREKVSGKLCNCYTLTRCFKHPIWLDFCLWFYYVCIFLEELIWTPTNGRNNLL